MVRVERGAQNVQPNFTSRSVARPRQSIVIFDASRQTVGKRCNFTSRSCVRPRQSLGRVARVPPNVQLYLAFSRSTTPTHCNFRYVMPNGRKKMQLYLAFVRSTTPIHGKGLRVMATRCHFTTCSRARPRQSMVRVAFPTEASELAPALERIFKL